MRYYFYKFSFRWSSSSLSSIKFAYSFLTKGTTFIYFLVLVFEIHICNDSIHFTFNTIFFLKSNTRIEEGSLLTFICTSSCFGGSEFTWSLLFIIAFDFIYYLIAYNNNIIIEHIELFVRLILFRHHLLHHLFCHLLDLYLCYFHHNLLRVIFSLLLTFIIIWVQVKA